MICMICLRCELLSTVCAGGRHIKIRSIYISILFRCRLSEILGWTARTLRFQMMSGFTRLKRVPLLQAVRMISFQVPEC